MTNYKRKSRIFLFLFILYIPISLVIFMGIYKWSSKKHENLRETVALQENKLDSTKTVIERLKTIQLADNYFTRGRYKEAKSSYESILKNYELSETQGNRIKERIERIGEILDSKENISIDLNEFQSALLEKDKRIDSLYIKIDSLRITAQQDLGEKMDKIAELKQSIKQKNRELAAKDRVKTISFTNEKGDFIYYLGEIENGKADGGGVGIWKKGGVYKGDWKDNKRHGEGIYEWTDGHKYVGEFENDTRQGEGKYYWPSGERYEGEWKDGKRNGFGILYDKDGNIQYEGQWKDDKITGKSD